MNNLEERLVKSGIITKEQFGQAKEEAYRCKKSFWAALVKLGFMSLDDLYVFFAQEGAAPYVKISDYKLNPETIALIDEGFCRQNLVMPLFKIKSTLFVACSNPLDSALIDNLAKLCGLEIEPLTSPAHSILKALDLYYGCEDKTFELEKFIVEQAQLSGLAFWRESERLALNIAASINIDDTSLVAPCTLPIECYTHDISRNGAALGLEILLYLPRGTGVSLEFKPSPLASNTIQAKGEIVYCRMEKARRYFLGIKFTEISEDARRQLFKLAGRG